MSLTFFQPTGPHGYLANYWPASFLLDGHMWATVEHYYQAQKFRRDPATMMLIAGSASPSRAKEIARALRDGRDPNWAEIRENVMYQAISAKFIQNKDLADKLIATGDEDIVEGADDDDYWGSGRDGLGSNRMGKLLMRLRSELKDRSFDIAA